MKLRSLEAFCAAVEEKSISAAARRMYLSQPSVSEKLIELEREAQVPLLERSRRSIELTPEGATIYEKARKILNEVKALELILRNLRNKDDMKLRFAACVTVGERTLPRWLLRFEREMPGVVPTVITGNDPEIVSVVESGEMPIGIVASDESCDPFESAPILDDELVVVVGPTHPWAQQRISPEDLSREPFISREKESAVRTITERTLEERGITLNVRMELGSTIAVEEIVEAGRGFSILSRVDVQRRLEVGTLVEVEGFSVPWSFKLIRRPSAHLSLAERLFCEFLLDGRKLTRSASQNRYQGTGPSL
jgi:DNA-binding transcriptional LysR family regulator